MNQDRILIASASQTIGPFFSFALTANRSLGMMAPADTKGERIHLAIRVLDGDWAPVPDCMIELWQADAHGTYSHPEDPGNQNADFHGFGRLPTNDQGECVFETIRPGRVLGPNGSPQAPHINVSVFARGILRHLNTRIYFAGDPANEEDAVLSLVPEDRRERLFAHPDPLQAGVLRFTISLCGAGETPFFDL